MRTRSNKQIGEVSSDEEQIHKKRRVQKQLPKESSFLSSPEEEYSSDSNLSEDIDYKSSSSEEQFMSDEIKSSDISQDDNTVSENEDDITEKEDEKEEDDDISPYDKVREGLSDDEQTMFSNLLKRISKVNSNEIFNDDDPQVVSIKKNKKLYRELRYIRQYILDHVITLKEILKSPYKVKDRAKLLEIYENLNTFLPFSDDWILTKDNLRKKYKEFKRSSNNNYTSEQLTDLKKHSKELKNIKYKKDEKESICFLNTASENKSVIYNRLTEKNSYNTASEEYPKLVNWIKVALSLPYDNMVKIELPFNFYGYAMSILDENLYGMRYVKEQILTYLSVKISNPNTDNQPLGLIGPPGVGKTCISRLISKIFNTPFRQICLGGVYNSEFLKGHSFVYVGSREGEMTRSLVDMRCKNGIILFDEFEKISDNKDLVSTLLHIMDPSQNFEFSDNYLQGIKYDLSKILFILSMNTLPDDSAIRDRFFKICVDGYSTSEKVDILLKHTIPKAIKNVGMKNEDLIFSKDVLTYFVNKVDTEKNKGVRTVNSYITDVIYKLNLLYRIQLNRIQDNKAQLNSIQDDKNKNKISFEIGDITLPFKISTDHLNILIKDKTDRLSYFT